MRLSVSSSHQFNVDAIGDIQLIKPEGPLIVCGVLYCKAICGVVLSIGHLISQKILVDFINNEFILHQESCTFHTFYQNSRWYFRVHDYIKQPSISPIIIDTIYPPPPINFLTKPTNSSMNPSTLRHQRLGHLSIHNIKCLLQFKAADGVPQCLLNDVNICHSCSISKSKHLPFHSPSRKNIEGPGDVIVAYLIEPLPTSIDNKKYSLLIQDFYSRLVALIHLSDKSKAKIQLCLWIIQFINVTTFKIKVIRMDNGAEFVNNFFDDFLKQHGIVHEKSMPYEHHQNGKIERTNRAILEIAQTSLLATNLEAGLWPFAFKHAAWIYNWTLHGDSKQTPYEIVSKKKPSLLPLRTFGSKSYIHDHNYCKDLSARAIVGYHPGIAPDSKGWLFWIPKSRRVARASSVKFDKGNFFPYNIPSRGSAMSIQAKNIFDSSMIKELEQQESFISTINHTHDLCNLIPTTYKEALSSNEKIQWQEAITEELSSMIQEEVFKNVLIKDALNEVPHNSILSTKWVFVKKCKPKRYMARLVAQGFKQIHGINSDETFAPTPTPGALRLLFSISCTNNWPIWTFNFKVAFLHSLIDKPVYVRPPKGMVISKHTILKMRKALYGTKQAARYQGKAILWIHVDDGVLTASTNKILSEISDKLDKALKVKWDTSISGLVSILITQTTNGYAFSQKDLILKLLGLNKSNITAKSPLPTNCDLKSNKANELDK
ncbi:hypothetical protein O181_078094 [Austropuccinia psidii MF-1]|uniref:Integrase catalytic domain-containing protein n=1 Tax=Austropuccinia psidii MF-1 TaxID=1389203 RepID=A0A9Q3FFU3_9BASI|nr:hypothetical protein [Austropuccinia psidii MF-1]